MKKCRSCRSEIDDKAKKCPYCRTNQKNWFIRHPILTFILAFFFLSGFISALPTSPKSSSQNNTNIPNPTPSPKVISEEDKASLVESFCKNRQGEYYSGVFLCSSCIDLNEVLDKSDLIHNAKSPATSENCQKFVDVCLKTWSEEECQKIAEQKIWLGMSRDQLVLSWGVSKDTNDTVGSWGVHSQWVYGDFGPYVYLEGKSKSDLVVTSWQD